jgi:hypothetical protein
MVDVARVRRARLVTGRHLADLDAADWAMAPH